MFKMQFPKSPKLYETKRKITNLPTLKLENKNEYEEDEIGFIDNISFNNIEPKYKNNYSIISIPSTQISYDKYISFLCELEMFEWKEYFHRARIEYVITNMYNRLFVSYLCKTIGNDITLYSDIFTENYEPSYMFFRNTITKSPYYKNELNLDEITKKLIREKFEGKIIYTSEPIYIMEFIDDDEYQYNFFYSESIMESNTRHVFVTVTIEYLESTHYCFLFIDHEKRLVEFYDPYASKSEKEAIEFIYSCLIMLFGDYEIEDFWKTKGIQSVEEIELSNEEGFCVIWGNMMMHLKLLNINTRIIQLEELFIQECYEKKLSLYEVMLNYAYFMTRVVPRKEDKFIELEKIMI